MNIKLRQAAEALVKKLEVVHADPAYISVWTLNQLHNGPYRGPIYTEEFNELRKAINEDHQ